MGRVISQRQLGYMAGGAAALVVAVVALSNYEGSSEDRPSGAENRPSGLVASDPAPDAARSGPGTSASSSGPAASVPARGPIATRRAVPPHERVAKPEAVRGLYLNAWAAGSHRKLDKLIGIANRTEVNTFVIDVKEGGEISYRSSVRLAAEIGADQQYIRDIQRVLAKLKANGIYPIARIVAFKDRVLARAKPAWAVQKADGRLWQDHHGDVWVDSFNKDVWDYNIAIAREAIELGFSEVQWDYVRFPDVPRSYMRTAVWPAQQGRTKEDAIREFLRYSREQLADLGVPVTADVFGLTVSADDDMGIGQLWEKMVDATDVLLPMVYPSHFARGSYGIAYPNANPYDVIKTSLGHAVRRTQGVATGASIRPWLQDFTLGPPRYGAPHVRAQINAVYDAGLDEWILWNPGSNYTVSALATRDGVVPQFATPQGRPATATKPAGAVPVRADSTPKANRADSTKSTLWGVPVRADSIRRDTIRR